jgi:23S rRNA-/tRNA-specific pseudouridylate synthase
VLLLAKSEGALNSISDLFEQRRVEKVYLAVVHGVPKQTEWTCTIKLGGEPGQIGRVQADPVNGKDAETRFRVLQTREDPVRGPLTLIEAHPLTGRTHQIRVHLAESGFEIIGDKLYGQPEPGGEIPLGLRGVFLGYRCPFTKKNVEISASVKEFFKQYGFTPRS